MEPGRGVVKMYGSGPGGEKITITVDCQGRSEDGMEGFEEDEPKSEHDAGAEAEEDEGKGAEYPFEVAIARGGTKMIYKCTTSADGTLVVHNVQHVPAGAEEGDHELYHGPLFDDLAPELQNALTNYLYDCNVDAEVGYFIALCSDWKEEKEYVNWLTQIKSFVPK